MVRAQLAVLLAAILCLSASMVYAERYKVVSDRFGNLDAQPSSTLEEQSSDDAPHKEDRPSENASQPEQPIQPEMSPQTAESVQNDPARSLKGEEVAEPPAVSGSVLEADPKSNEPLAASTSLEASAPVVAEIAEKGGVSEDPPEFGNVQEVPQQPLNEPVAPRRLGVFEKAFLKSEGQNPYDATEIDEADFVDSQDLLDGKITPNDSERPFFVTRDQDGIESVTFYSPSLAIQAKEKSKDRLKFSPATVYKHSDEEGAYLPNLESADPTAIDILTSGRGTFENYFGSFRRRCCEQLPKAGIKTLMFERPEHLKVLQDSLPYRFFEGDSRYVICKLPESDKNYAIELRAYVREYRDLQIELGVFYPQLVTMDAQMNPLRIIADPVMTFTPETWSNYGYLQGTFEIDRAEGAEEVYLMLNTTRSHLRQLSEFEVEEGVSTIQHMRFGDLGIKALQL